jgi:benzoyl-CoA reductase subunit D
VAVVHTDDHGGERRPAITERIRRRDSLAVVETVYQAFARPTVAGDATYVATTGEGESVPFRTGHFYGMTTHARGGLFLEPTARGVIDIGALHARAVRKDERAKVLGYRMTSQCASGSGQFLENIARYLGVTLEEIGRLSRTGDKPEACSTWSRAASRFRTSCVASTSRWRVAT